MPARNAPLADPSDKLERYRQKRSADRTPEPFGEGQARPQQFVIQKHAARRLHYDFRLEMGGVLQSWAVPHGPSLDPAQKRLAVQVEDHPVEYADFEGVIPEGNYGAGAVIVWDRGLWIPIEDPEEGLKKGKLLFDLKGHKLRGRWTLVRIKGSAKDWLLIKKQDGWSAPEGTRPLPPESILSGLTLEDVARGENRSAELRAAIEKLGAPRRRVEASKVELMLAEFREKAFSDKGWLFELKYDGFRLLASRDDGEAHLLYRRGSDSTAIFPDVAKAVAALPFPRFVIDGEVTVLDDRARPSFQLLQQRVQLTRPQDIARAAVSRPATFYAFDLLAFDDFDLRPLPLSARKALLKRMLPAAGPIRFADHVEERGEELFDKVRGLGLEGIVAKKADAPYRGGRSSQWLKIRVERSSDFVVVGFTRPEGTRVGFGALHLAVFEGGELVYAGRAGTGFDTKQLEEIRSELDRIRRPTPPCSGPIPQGKEHLWVEPKLICEVKFREWTKDALLRMPVFVRFRTDKKIEECVREGEPLLPGSVGRGLAARRGSRRSAKEEPRPGPNRSAAEKRDTASERRINFTHLDKVFWPEEGYTKGDLIEAYRKLSPWLLPYLHDRPVVLTRYPDGIEGKSFFQKDAPGFVPGWIHTERMWSEHAQREIDYFVCDDVESLLYLANLGTIPLHIWASRVTSLQRPDWCILDLDPKGAPFSHVVEVAKAIHALCDEIGLPTFVKTSGSTGLHVMIPLGAQVTYEQCRSLGQLIAQIVAGQLSEIATTARMIGARANRVYIDFLQNGHGRLLAAPFSVRPVPGALVSTPLDWKEVNSKLDIHKFTIRTVPARMKRLGRDPLLPILDKKPDLLRALTRLHKRVGS